MTPNPSDLIHRFLEAPAFAVAGASPDRSKYGNKVLRCYLQHGRKAYPIHPSAPTVEGVAAYPSLEALPEAVTAVSIITPPPVTERIVEAAGALGVKVLWMQPGAESDRAIARARELGMEVIAGGPCLLVVLGYHEG